MEYYYPSCNFRAQYPETSKAVISYMESQNAVIENCCRVCKDHPHQGDTILTVCTTCRLILDENRKDCNVETVYDHILRDPSFSYPDLSGRHFILQKCAKADDCFTESVIRLLDFMHVDYEISPEENYCGRFMMTPVVKRNMDAATIAFTKLQERIHPASKDEQDAFIQKTAEALAGKEVLVYCNSCHRELKQAGADAVHLLELLFAKRG